MSATDLIGLLADEDGSVNAEDAINALKHSITQLRVDEGVELNGQDILNLQAAHIEYVHDLLAEQVLAMQQRFDMIAVMVNRMAGGEAAAPVQMDVEKEMQNLRFGSRLDSLARIFDLLTEYHNEGEALVDEYDGVEDDG